MCVHIGVAFWCSRKEFNVGWLIVLVDDGLWGCRMGMRRGRQVSGGGGVKGGVTG
jgi:hypothetical protein